MSKLLPAKRKLDAALRILESLDSRPGRKIHALLAPARIRAQRDVQHSARLDYPTMHNHLNVLKKAGLVSAEKVGTRVILHWNLERASQIACICKQLAGTQPRV